MSWQGPWSARSTVSTLLAGPWLAAMSPSGGGMLDDGRRSKGMRSLCRNITCWPRRLRQKLIEAFRAAKGTSGGVAIFLKKSLGGRLCTTTPSRDVDSSLSPFDSRTMSSSLSPSILSAARACKALSIPASCRPCFSSPDLERSLDGGRRLQCRQQSHAIMPCLHSLCSLCQRWLWTGKALTALTPLLKWT